MVCELRQPSASFLAETQPSSHDLVCGSIHSLPKGPCPKGRTDSGRSYPIVAAQHAAPVIRAKILEREGPLRNQRPFLFFACRRNQRDISRRSQTCDFSAPRQLPYF